MCGGGEIPPIFSESVQVCPTSKCFRQRSVNDDGWKFYKQCSTVIGRVVLSQSRRWHLKKFSQTYYCRSGQSTIGQSNHWIVRLLRQSKGIFCPNIDLSVQKKAVGNVQSFQSGTGVSIMAGPLRGAVCSLPPRSRGPHV